ncbi:hypothetical protein WI29_18480 [Burkholderia ubonensis]|nr:hypothetical protein WI31_30765 [Burkholderia ubonensis]KUZ17035.1 hypothetical protein WI29_18480 [Burkholderia ubonensis]KUZ20858.1 hypothetical protein WI30_33865 [Burkholderia ubonensis]KUZ26331.1 hypothetical protein WI32_29920 [Burkholderia ubonensis]KUZ44394.1 hypothetical protein WI33_00655 [Burkholderia ubonensis]
MEALMSNTQVTHDVNLNNARSESNVAINPNQPMQIVCGSKKFRDIHTYDFTLATAYSADGGYSWHDSSDLQLQGGTVLTDPALAWDDLGGVYLVGLLGNNPPTFDTVGIVIYKSPDGGQTWGAPRLIHSSAGDDKQWAAGDANPTSPYRGRVYAVWDDGADMRFARTLDHGVSWVGAGTGPTPAGTVLVSDSFSPDIRVAENGDIYIVWIAGSEIKMIVSTNGGDSFSAAPSPATGVTTLGQGLPAPNGWPVFPGGSFRVLTIPSMCVHKKQIVVAWADFRQNVSRIYCAVSHNSGGNWLTGPSGKPLLAGPLPASLQHFHPQMAVDSSGRIGCAFYEFGPKPATPLIDVVVAQSIDGGNSFDAAVVTDQPWDPSVDAPWSHGNSNVTFIGDYFGLDANSQGFHPVWTDTRTGIQELWTDIVHALPAYSIPPGLYGQVAQILAGIIQDGGGIETVGGHIIHVPPWGPEVDILVGVAIQRIATLVANPAGIEIQRSAMAMIAHVAQQEVQRLAREQQGELSWRQAMTRPSLIPPAPDASERSPETARSPETQEAGR